MPRNRNHHNFSNVKDSRGEYIWTGNRSYKCNHCLGDIFTDSNPEADFRAKLGFAGVLEEERCCPAGPNVPKKRLYDIQQEEEEDERRRKEESDKLRGKRRQEDDSPRGSHRTSPPRESHRARRRSSASDIDRPKIQRRPSADSKWGFGGKESFHEEREFAYTNEELSYRDEERRGGMKKGAGRERGGVQFSESTKRGS